MPLNLFVVAVSIHAIVAFAGVGLIGAVPIVAASSRRGGAGVATAAQSLGTLLRYAQWSLAIVAISGVAIEFAAGGAFHATWWFRASIALFLFVGFAQARARRALRSGLAGGGDDASALRRVERWGWTTYAATCAVVVLMVVKP
jgi:hypothetical protein